jgi:tetratricopeptide (TPR) repeat protein
VAKLEKQLTTEPANLQLAFKLASDYAQLQQTNRALQLVDQFIASPQADVNTLLFAAEICRQFSQFSRVEQALEKVVKLMPESPEAWFDLGGFQALLNKQPQAMESLRKALQLSAQRLAREPNAANLYNNALADARLQVLRDTPEFQKLLADHKPAAK